MTDIWNRIEPTNDAISVTRGLTVPLGDPLWLLGRQWQIGELTAEDAATPISVTVTTTAFPLERLVVGEHVRSFDASLPLEAHVEPEPAVAPDLRMRLTAGRDLLVALEAAHLTAAAHALPLIAPPPPTSLVDRLSLALVRAMGARAVDAEALHHAIRTTSLAAASTSLDAARAADVAAVLSPWLALYRQRTGRAAPSAWNDELATYQFSVAASVGNGIDVILDATAYRGGTLDWCDFAARTEPRAATAPPPPPPITNTTTLLPAPLEFAGGPARRFFELERGGASFTLLSGAPSDVATALLVEVTLLFGGDWFVVPIEMPVGSLGRVDTIAVTDTFDPIPTLLTGRIRDGQWRMFECAGDPLAADLLPILPTAATSLEGAVIERVALVRDEAANLVWAVEDVVVDALGNPATVDHAPPTMPVGPTHTYLPFIPPPANWFPLVRRGSAQPRYQGATLRVATTQPSPQGALLASFPDTSFRTETVAADGIRIERAFQLAIAAEGTRALWITRRARVARGPASSGVAADQLIAPTRRT